ncbi:hypothetical protein [Mesorhizobium sp. L-2-11]|uniref:hypothetical protein n=1 Tax=Mesorhizobium sp. L-2-11 TaxID=2744521 RepID=UPI0018EC085C|nr:hypothetical protein [Mesorhizobium sp. L-2-11]BCH20163.1 hypothetical protein MesoLjLa_70140 [Mesorhizobium sp. L-2-11]
MEKPSWRIRRRIIIATLLFCAGEIIYLTLFGDDTSLAETIANGVLILAGSTIGSYVFGAVWDDRNVMAMRKPDPGTTTLTATYVEPQPSPQQTPPPKDFAG